MGEVNKRAIAIGVSSVEYATYGDGVPGSDFTKLPATSKGTVVFGFQDPKEVKIEVDGSDEPLAVLLLKDSTDYIEFSIPSPPNEVLVALKGGKVSKGTGDQNIWEEPTTIPSISKTVRVTSIPYEGKKVIYTIVNGKIMARLGEAPGPEKSETLFVRVYKQAAITAEGEAKTAFTREIAKDVA